MVAAADIIDGLLLKPFTLKAMGEAIDPAFYAVPNWQRTAPGPVTLARSASPMKRP